MSSTEITSAAREYRELQGLIRSLEEQADALKARITTEMNARGVDTMRADVFTIHWTSYTSTRLDTKAIQKEHPDIAARYARTVEARRFQIADKGPIHHNLTGAVYEAPILPPHERVMFPS